MASGGSSGRIGEAGLVIDGRYRLEQLLGAGGFGEVWRARQEVEGSEVRPVALKLLYAPDSADGTPSALGSSGASASASSGGHRWLDEVRAVRDVRCKSVATIFDVGISREPRVAFIAMELLRGQTLDDRLERGPVYWRRALAITREVVTALVACHSVDVSHCDLKPQNVFLDSGGEVYVLDFGVAALGNVTESQRRRRAATPAAPVDAGELFDMGATGAVSLDEMPDAVASGDGVIQLFGTPGYIAPESYRGEAPGPDSDTFALGVLLYRMIAGRLPHRLPADVERPSGVTTADTRQRYQAALNSATVHGDFRPLTDSVAGVPDAVASFIDRLLASEPRDRPTSELVSALDEVLHRPFGVPDPPYVGLQAFDERRAGYIAGRDADIDEVAGKLVEHRAVVMCGPSGCGKSSLAIAGVAARIDEELLLGSDGWRLRVLRPSADAGALRVMPGCGRDLVDDGTGLVVVVDQLEEVVRLADEERVEFCNALATLVEGSDDVELFDQPVARERPVRVIATVRDDLFGRVASLPELRRFPEQNLYTVRGVEPNAMAAIVEGPARAAGYSLEGGDDVVNEAVGILAEDSGALPLVQFALTRWWEERDRERKLLTRSEWDKIGGIEGALAEAAQTVHDNLDERERELMRSLLLALFRHDGTRVRVDEAAVVGDDVGRAVLKRLLERRLVSRHTDADGGATLEVVHEALGRRWPLLHTWLEETRSERELIHDAEYDAVRWQRAGGPDELLWRGSRLAAALVHRDKMASAGEFIDMAAKVEERETWTRRGFAGLLIALVAAAIVLMLVYVASNRQRSKAKAAQAIAEEARDQSEQALHRNEKLRSEAEVATARAIQEQRKAEYQRVKAEAATAEARSESEKNAALRDASERAEAGAVAARNQAESAMRQAQAEKREADRQRELNRLAAERAEKQRREAETQRKYAETAQRLHELARRRMERIEAQFDKVKRERELVRDELDKCRGQQ